MYCRFDQSFMIVKQMFSALEMFESVFKLLESTTTFKLAEMTEGGLQQHGLWEGIWRISNHRNGFVWFKKLHILFILFPLSFTSL